jgi:hypothetical protein
MNLPEVSKLSPWIFIELAKPSRGIFLRSILNTSIQTIFSKNYQSPRPFDAPAI